MTWCNKHVNFYYLFNKVPILLSSVLFHALYLVSTLVCIFCIICGLGALGVAREIQIIGSLQNEWLGHNQFMGLGNPLEAIVHHLLIGGMTSLSYQDEFPMYDFILNMNYGESWRMAIKLSWLHHRATSLYCLSTLREYWVCVKVSSDFDL